MLPNHKTEKSKKGKKGQLSTIDLFIAVLVFSVLLVTMMTAWNSYNKKIAERVEYNHLMAKAFQISDVLVKTSGIPARWNESNVRIIGLATQDRILSSDKVNAFVNLPLDKTQDIFKAYGYDFYFNLTNLAGETLKQHGVKPTTTKKSVNLRRYVLYNDEPAIMEFTLWK